MKSENGINILLVEDREIVRKSLSTLINGYSGWRVCGEAANRRETIEKTLALNPDLVLDIHMPLMNEIDATRQIHGIYLATKVIMVSIYDSMTMAAEAASAHAYVGKSQAWADLRAQ